MTQGIQNSTRTHEFSKAYLIRITPRVPEAAGKREDNWFFTAITDLLRVLVGPRVDRLPDSLLDDVALGNHAKEAQLRADFSRLDAQLHSRIY